MKKFTDFYINYSNILKYAVVGFEFEFYTDKPYYKMLEFFNRELAPIKTHGFRVYHSNFTPDENNFKVEHDSSGGGNLLEMVTGPMKYPDCKIIMLKVMKCLQEIATTNEKCSLHINISFEKDAEKNIDNLVPIKLMLDVDEDLVYQFFPNRENNYYAKSVKKLIPFKGFTQTDGVVDLLINNIELPDTKYYGINMKNADRGWLEYRYVGGENYQFKTKEILNLLDYFILLTWNCIDVEINEEDKEKILDYLNDNVSNFKKFIKLDDFIAEYPSIKLEVDKGDEWVIVNSYYGNMYDKIYDLLMNTYNLSDAIINYDTETQKIEVIDTTIKGIFDLMYYNFVQCQVIDGTFFKCFFGDSEVKNSQIENSEISSCEVTNCKLTDCEVTNGTVLENCYFYGGVMDGEMNSGIIRGGKIGPNAIIGDGVKLVTDDDNYFGTDNSGDLSKLGKNKYVKK